MDEHISGGYRPWNPDRDYDEISDDEVSDDGLTDDMKARGYKAWDPNQEIDDDADDDFSDDDYDDDLEGMTLPSRGGHAGGSTAPIIPDSTSMEFSELLSTYEGEEVDRTRMSDSLWVDPQPGVVTRTHYMDSQEREDYRLNVSEDGKLVDSEGVLYTSSSDNAHGHYPGSTGGDIFVLDQGGLFAGDVAQIQQYVQDNAEPGVREMVHHSTLAAGQRNGGDEQSSLRVFGAGEIEARDGEVRSISDASGHFRPDTSDTLQVVETLEDHGVNLDNTKINLVGKSEYDDDGNVPSIDVYSGEFKQTEGDQRLLTNKRGVMDELRQTQSARRQQLDEEAEERARRISGATQGDDFDDSDDFDDDSEDSSELGFVDRGYLQENEPNLGSTYVDDQGEPIPGGTYVSDQEEAERLVAQDDGMEGDSSTEESDEDAMRWQSAQPQQGERSGPRIGVQREIDGDSSTQEALEGAQWQSGAPQQGERSGITIGEERETRRQTWQSARPQGPRIGTHRGR